MTRQRSYVDEDLRRAVAESRSWRGVLGSLGLAGTSSGAIRSVRARADHLGLDYGHFVGQRRWTEEQLRAAVANATTWTQAADGIGLIGRVGVATAKGHATRLGLSTSHLDVGAPTESSQEWGPQITNLDRAGPLLAAAWFTLCGHDVSWPLEPSRYDLIVHRADGLHRVQVKTTTVRQGASWKVYLSTTSGERRPYDPDEIDEFFVIDGDLDYYLIPVSAVGGLHAIHLNAYQGFLLELQMATRSAMSGRRPSPDSAHPEA
ncbi:group I intron-associated PD-(D/E)XK endonuclease [Isoptericola dokdonensis]|uniref:PD(D/E)XK endonuclease domain-containing protein n=1 Tax=Isoptericola dokdonensis DS-3 TaxID=1300344 RepID=A0A168ENX0_9MICO|nr:group I intron-associated PD-(D/E)XK endonuclease [Isoptericola dokdonensis]ANC30282.1 hypothetical protein I598_0704 [Isoptericola dokdonensis DS-3]